MKLKALVVPVCLFVSQLSFAAAKLPTNYQSYSAEEKLATLERFIARSEYKELPTTFPLTSMWKLFSTSFLNTTMDRASDEMPQGRLKLIHSFGAAARVNFVVTAQENPYTGIFKTGAQGLLRASLAHPFPSYTPGFGLKFLIDGKKSVNVFAMNSLDGQGDNRNFFAKAFRTKIDMPQSAPLKLLAEIFGKAMRRFDVNGSPVHLPLDHVAAINVDGTKVAKAVYPDHLVFVPAIDGFNPHSQEDLRLQLGRLASGTPLYHVFAEDNNGRRLLGKLVLEGEFISSEFGDYNLFFEHHPGGSKSSSTGSGR